MNTRAMLLHCVLISIIANAVSLQPGKYKMIRVQVQNEKQVGTLRQLQKSNELDFTNEPESGSATFSLPSIYSGVVERKLLAEGMKPVTIIEDLESAILKERKDNQPQAFERTTSYDGSNLRNFNYARFHTLSEIYDFLRTVASERFKVARFIEIGKSYENRSISGLQITLGRHRKKPVIFLECGIHAREWITPAVCLYFIHQLTTEGNPGTRRLIKKYEWYIIPTTNPDGYHYTWIKPEWKYRHWRKTRSPIPKNETCFVGDPFGVDPNRNFDTPNFCKGPNVSNDPCDEDAYCGRYPFSEKETQALRDTINKVGDRLRMYFSFHSFKQQWLYPYAYTKELAPNAKQLDSLSLIGVKALQAVYGTKYEYGPISKVIYPVSGSSVDWVYDNSNCKLVFALELQHKESGWEISKEEIIPTANETWSGIKAVVNSAENY